jgi:hypothetical protein
MTHKIVLAFAVALASVLTLTSTPGYAATLSFDFSFPNGLTNNATSAATHVIVDSYPAGLILPAAPFETNVSAAAPSSFTVSNGSITEAGYAVSIPTGGPFVGTLCLSLGPSPAGTCGTAGDSFLEDGQLNDVEGPVTFTATPLPTALPLFATGIGALGLLGWCRKRKAQAVA